MKNIYFKTRKSIINQASLSLGESLLTTPTLFFYVVDKNLRHVPDSLAFQIFGDKLVLMFDFLFENPLSYHLISKNFGLFVVFGTFYKLLNSWLFKFSFFPNSIGCRRLPKYWIGLD
jgi:hypothetical protein